MTTPTRKNNSTNDIDVGVGAYNLYRPSNLSEDDLQSPAVRTFLAGRIEELQKDVKELETYRLRCGTLKCENGILKVYRQTEIASDIIFGALMALGGAAFSAVTAFNDDSKLQWLLGGSGMILLFVGCIAKYVAKKTPPTS